MEEDERKRVDLLELEARGAGGGGFVTTLLSLAVGSTRVLVSFSFKLFHVYTVNKDFSFPLPYSSRKAINIKDPIIFNF